MCILLESEVSYRILCWGEGEEGESILDNEWLYSIPFRVMMFITMHIIKVQKSGGGGGGAQARGPFPTPCIKHCGCEC